MKESRRLQCSAWDALGDKQLHVWLMTSHKVSHIRMRDLGGRGAADHIIASTFRHFSETVQSRKDGSEAQPAVASQSWTP